MARADQIKALIRSYAEGDEARFFSVAMQMAAQAARSGQTRFATELRSLIDEAKEERKQLGKGMKPVPMVQPRGELAGLLSAEYPTTRLTDMVLPVELRERLERVVLEHRQSQRLREHGLAPLRKLLLIGPPGTGKTMTAKALAGEMHLPLFTIVLHSLITRYMGETAAKLRLVFDAISEVRGVYLFDEFDALGGDRGAPNDVGEIRRVLNSFLQFLEADDSGSLVIAATNHPKLLDRALWRRFDEVFRYQLPDPSFATETMKARLASLGTATVDWERVMPCTESLSYADLIQACEEAAKRAILENRESLETDEVLSALERRRSIHHGE